MAKRPIDEDITTNMETKSPGLELVRFRTQSMDGDYYDPKKVTNVEAAFVSNETSDNKPIQVSHAI